MNRILLGLLFFFCCTSASAQKVYFIYIQSESEQPFYVKMNNRVHSSTASGYLILSKLRDSTHNLTVGFPGNKWPEQQFAVAMNRKDKGFILKNFGDKGWGLFDMQSLAVQMGTGTTARVNNSGGGDSQPVSIFASILAKASDDPSLLEKIVVTSPVKKESVEKKTDPVVVKKEEPKTEKTTPPVETVGNKTEPSVVKKEEAKPPVIPVTSEPVAKKEEPKTEKTDPAVQPAVTTIKKEDSKPSTADAGVTQKPAENPEVTSVKKEDPPKVVEFTEEKKPVAGNEQPARKEESKAVITELPPVTTDDKIQTEQKPVVGDKTEEAFKRSIVKRRSESSTTEGFGLVFTDETGEGATDTIRIMIPNTNPVVAPKKEEPKEERKFLEITPADVPVQTNQGAVKTQGTAAIKPAKNRCMAVADEADFLRVRKKMASATSEDNMINEAKKVFKARCFSTQQVKNLNALFLKDESKYKFFDMAYDYVSDIENFPSLESELKDAYYITRFKAMLR